MGNTHKHDPLRPHTHDPNPKPPTADATFILKRPDGDETRITVRDLHDLPQAVVPGCLIVSTGHGTSGPFTFTGVTLYDLLQHYVTEPWREVEVIGADGFGNRVEHHELAEPDPAGPILLAHSVDGGRMEREEGLVRLVVPSERDDALRQVKWIGRINVR
ncbi:MAG: molybdopterin-dependent oxidoreductase [Candidatus Promineifilaceae bacterium]|nr:molybdopterin-dependent oxidoreductase [Candidatus Promineifilaceae bacterium]